MKDGTLFIFKTLIKVPVYITIFFTIFNLFAFVVIYFQALGFSYILMQTVVENNFIPNTERNTLENYAATNFAAPSAGYVPLGAGGRDRATIVSDNGLNPAEDRLMIDWAEIRVTPNNQRVQYGGVKTVGIHLEYVIIMPLQTREQMDNPDDMLVGYDDTGAAIPTFLDTAALESRLENERNAANPFGGLNRIPINITYTVPGLKFYPDLS